MTRVPFRRTYEISVSRYTILDHTSRNYNSHFRFNNFTNFLPNNDLSGELQISRAINIQRFRQSAGRSLCTYSPKFWYYIAYLIGERRQIRGENEICAIGSLATVISNVLISHFSHVEMRCDSLRFLDVYARDMYNYTENRLNFDRYLSLINGSWLAVRRTDPGEMIQMNRPTKWRPRCKNCHDWSADVTVTNCAGETGSYVFLNVPWITYYT